MKRLLPVLIGLLLSGCGAFRHPAPDQQKILHYQCGTLPLTVTLDQQRDQVRFIMDGQPLTLDRLVAASGTRYGNEHYIFWSKGNSAFIERNGRLVVNDCQRQPAA